MIINPRGTSGSGKTWLVRQICDLYGWKRRQMFHQQGRRQPLYYRLKHPGDGLDLYVLGHYETACGGCDTIPKLDEIYRHIDILARYGDVLYEGLLVSAEFNRAADLADHHDLVVLELSTPLERCLENVNARRAARGKEEPVNPKNTESKHRGVTRTCERLRETRAEVHLVSTEEALRMARELLRV